MPQGTHPPYAFTLSSLSPDQGERWHAEESSKPALLSVCYSPLPCTYKPRSYLPPSTQHTTAIHTHTRRFHQRQFQQRPFPSPNVVRLVVAGRPEPERAAKRRLTARWVGAGQRATHFSSEDHGLPLPRLDCLVQGAGYYLLPLPGSQLRTAGFLTILTRKTHSQAIRLSD